MPKTPLCRLERVDLREYWEKEATEFTPWLGADENISLLGDTIELELEVIEQEANVGSYRADIVCRNTADDSLVLIENQLEATDHCHLGQLLTYASGLDAVTVVWIAQRFTEEHRAALDWLNRISEEGFNFFGLEVELWRIGDSAAAPKFNVVAQPNDWRKAVRAMSAKGGSPTERLGFEFWEGLADHLASRDSTVPRIKPRARSWVGLGLGRSGTQLGASYGVRDKFVSVWVDLTGTYAKSFFRQLRADREAVERELGGSLEWQEKPKYQGSSIVLRRRAETTDRDLWPELFEWIAEMLERFDQIFRPRVKGLLVTEADLESER